MLTRTLLSLSVAAVAVGANANMDQIEFIGGLSGAMAFSKMEIYGGWPEGNSTVIDDFNSAGVVTDVAVAFVLADPTIFGQLGSLVRGWQVSFWADPGTATLSGLNMNDNALAEQLVTTGITYSEIIPGRAFRVDISGLSLNTGAGLVWIGMAPVIDFGPEQFFILSNKTPADRGGGGANDGYFLQPGAGFGFGQLVPVEADAAYAVRSVPEPATMLALGAGLAALVARRRK